MANEDLRITREMAMGSCAPIKLVVTGMLVDLELYNGWVKRDQFVPVPAALGEVIIMDNESFRSSLPHVTRLKLNFVGPTNEVIELSCRVECTRYSTMGSSGTAEAPNNMSITEVQLNNHDMSVSNPRLCVSVQLGKMVFGNDGYIDGDFIRRNIPHSDPRFDQRRY